MNKVLTICCFVFLALVVPARAAAERGALYPISQYVGSDLKMGYINRAGAVVISPGFEAADPFFEDVARVESGGLWGYINRRGEFVIKLQFKLACGFAEGLACVQVGDKWGYVDRAGCFVIAPQFHSALPFLNGLARASTLVGSNSEGYRERSGYIDRTGKFVWSTII